MEHDGTMGRRIQVQPNEVGGMRGPWEEREEEKGGCWASRAGGWERASKIQAGRVVQNVEFGS